jgi:5'(3')-deoxyribonucleotidase
MQQKRILLDCDEVICDYCTPALAFVLERFGVHTDTAQLETWDIFQSLSLEQRSTFEEEFYCEGRCAAMIPYPGAVEAVQELRRHAEVVVVTRPPRHTRHWVHERTLWLIEQFGFDHETIVHTWAKHLVVGDMLIDDNPENVIKWQAYHPRGAGLLWATPNTDRIAACDGFRVRTWDEVIARIKAL